MVLVDHLASAGWSLEKYARFLVLGMEQFPFPFFEAPRIRHTVETGDRI